MTRDARVVVTGVGGLIGSHVARILRDSGYAVVGCDSFITGSRRNVPEQTELVEADCRDLSAMQKLCEGAALVVHCAAAAYEGLSVFSPRFVADHNFLASSTVFSAAVSAGARRVVFTSSMARYGRGDIPFRENQPTAPVDPYGVSKVATEMLLRTLSELHGIEYVIVVPHNVIGPGQRFDDAYRNVAAIMINRVLCGLPIIIYGDGLQRRSFTHVEDVAEQICALCLLPEATGRVFNLGGESSLTTVLDLARLVSERLGVTEPPLHLPARPGEVRDATCSHATLETFLGRKWTRTLDDALDSLIAEVRSLGAREARPTLPLEIHGPDVPEPWRTPRR
jgi:UDP-glucose 4-epimerase